MVVVFVLYCEWNMMKKFYYDYGELLVFFFSDKKKNYIEIIKFFLKFDESGLS